MQGPDKASIDATRTLGGVKLVGAGCPEPAPGEPPSLIETDACHVSLLAQYEMGGRSRVPGRSRSTACADSVRAGPRRLRCNSTSRGCWPTRTRTARHAPCGRALWERRALAFIERRRRSPSLEPGATSAAEPRPGPARRPDACGRWAAQLIGSSSRVVSVGQGKVARPALQLSYCGDWGDEIAVRNRAGHLIRSIAKGSRAWPSASPPATLTALRHHQRSRRGASRLGRRSVGLRREITGTDRLLQEAAVERRSPHR